MGVVHVGLVHRNPCECKVKGFCVVSSNERNVSKRRHLQGVQHDAHLQDALRNVPTLLPFELRFFDTSMDSSPGPIY